jgi:LytS/YehU family sensor histidine kinase
MQSELQTLKMQLHPHFFFNTLNRIKELYPASHGDFTVLLHDGTELVLSRTYRRNLSQNLGMSV